nr:hypothetical protein CFP56_32651 [Quercus suber]
MLEWEEWDGMRESGVSELVLIMPRLQVLTIDVCPKLKSLPNFLEKTSLEELTIDCRISNCMTLATLPGLKSLSCVNLNNGEHFSTLGKLLLLESLWISNTERVKKVSVEFLGIEEESNNNKIDDEKGSASSSSSSPLVLFPNLKSLKFWGNGRVGRMGWDWRNNERRSTKKWCYYHYYATSSVFEYLGMPQAEVTARLPSYNSIEDTEDQC